MKMEEDLFVVAEEIVGLAKVIIYSITIYNNTKNNNMILLLVYLIYFLSISMKEMYLICLVEVLVGP